MIERIPTPQDIMKRAIDAGFKNMGQACRQADVPYIQFHRWRVGKYAIRVDALQALLDATRTKDAAE
jgi:hypothetical protein